MTRIDIRSRSNRFRLFRVSLLVVTLIFGGPAALRAQDLLVSYGTKGVQTLSYRGTVLEDTVQYSQDTFHIGHLLCTDLQGNVISDSRCNWGETNSGELWNSSTQTETYRFPWGSITAQFVQNGSNLDITVTETNSAGSGLILDGSDILPLALHFPSDPRNFSGYSQNAITTTGPAVVAADFGSGVVTSVIPNESASLYGGWRAQGNAVYNPIVASTAPDGLASFYPSVNSPVSPGQSLSYTVSLRFSPEGVAANAQDAYSSFAAKYPNQMTWTDKRIIGTAYLATSPSGDSSIAGGFPTNPRRYYNDASVDITTALGMRSFQARILAQATSNVANAQAMSAQGVITWDIEGEQFPQSTSYVCSPDQIGVVAPEMESVITDSSSPYVGEKLDDAYFATMTNAGLRVGVCLRPQAFTLAMNGTASQVYLSSNSAIIANLENKAKYANTRWGTTLFYVDSTVDINGGTLDPAIFQQLVTDMPNFLFIPEESTPRYYAYTAPFYSFIFHTDLGTPASIYNAYPMAFGANLVNDADAGTLAEYQSQLTQSVARGDILMGHADWWQPNDPTLVQIYANAGGGVSKKTPQISWSIPSPIIFGSPLSATQLDATANVSGSFVYSPPAGTVLNAGIAALQATFTPTDTSGQNVATASTNLTVSQATPLLSWSTPAAVNLGTTLSANQLNATANIPGTFAYSPSSGTAVSIGTTLNASFTPTDAVNYSAQTASVFLSVNSSAPQPVTVTSPAPGAIISGVITVSAKIAVTLDPAGSYLMVDGVEVGARRVSSPPFLYSLDTTTFTNGPHTLQVWAHDIGDNSRLSAPVTVTVANGGPSNAVITWPTPSAIAYGTPLSAVQLNAEANVPGTFSYFPAAGALLSAGSQTLNATFTPADLTKSTTTKAVVALSVQPAAPSVVWTVPTSVSAGALLSGLQLNATASVPGTFVYTPAAGTSVTAGTKTLSVTFTPTDQTDYTPQSTNVSLLVTSVATPVVLTWLTPSAIPYGTPLSSGQLNATAPVPGTFVYSPTLGSVPSTGTDTLNVNFTPADTASYQPAFASVRLQVQAAAPVISWPIPTAINQGTVLSGAQLNATASVPGMFQYAPPAGTLLSAGTQTLNATFTPYDQTDYTTQTASVSLVVASVPRAAIVTWATPAAIYYGTALSAAQLNAAANVPGTFIYSPAAGSMLSTGTTTLNVTFTPADATSYLPVVASVRLQVQAAVPLINWPIPVAIIQGTALSAAQLDATANIPGSFVYSPSSGDVPPVGVSTLAATFNPTDGVNYSPQSAQVLLVVNSPTPQPVMILSPASGATVSGTIVVTGQLTLQLDPAGSYLMVDGVEIGNRRVSDQPYVYPLDTTSLANGMHTLQIWAHDTGNNVHLSAPVSLNVKN